MVLAHAHLGFGHLWHPRLLLRTQLTSDRGLSGAGLEELPVEVSAAALW